ncbi:hypothetical protein LOTGIDRAFT_158264 [Lottia gigantea]|uniref:Uncharacterized protein n=1 Tax=Lottia gigantea TaxID=225164 RepID=V4B180_LOTGI|nr:hypothetical protein LOTGIDRAFT_158264 [Lottia gigantea]ESP00037.1 hypothetical protein LOTGIDRAFT_158264 [Lottia gigantea]
MTLFPQTRLVRKSGRCNVKACNMKHRRLQFFLDGYTSLLECKWHLLIFIFLVSFVMTWILFSLMWYGVYNWHQNQKRDNAVNWKPCILNVKNFESIILFSIETQTTIGYGSRDVSEECSLGVFLLVVQSIFGAMLHALIAGTILAKIQSPAKRAKTVLFSKQACICLENDELCFMVRVGNLRRSEFVGATVRALFLAHKLTAEGDFLPHHLHEMAISLPESKVQNHLWWPATIIHRINESSPLFGISPEILKDSDFEIVILLEGGIASTSMAFQGRTSFKPSEIKWGYRFSPMFDRRNPFGLHHEVNFDHFDSVRLDATSPMMSASDWYYTRNRNADKNNFIRQRCVSNGSVLAMMLD